jgi:hypothetical protein
MKNVYIYCEGQTEESFINEILYPYFISRGLAVHPIICTTKHRASEKYRGGVLHYSKIKRELSILCKQHSNEYVTTMFDYYAMPDDTPGIHSTDPDLYARIKQIEVAIEEDIALRNCKFHFMLHEFEGILFSNPASFALIAEEDVVDRIQEIRDNYPTPEHINNSPETAPSKRLQELIPNYAKIKNGTLLSKDMGIDVIMEQCQHFKSWIEMLAALA